MDYDQIKELVTSNDIKWNGHATQRMRKREIDRNQVIEALLNGEIIEKYREDHPYPSCLIYGFTVDKEPLHVVCSVGQEKVWIITVYRPDKSRWHDDYKTRKDVK